ncbi:S-adenosyl-L-methionine-dependent methyltransferase [Xylariales sp. AK1849]|nr:S-adenosyl-L-methionine-dependent methyltransferase [Xylariales sp. AK1849]
MDSPIVTQLFRQLFQHPACHSRRNLVALSSCIQHGRKAQQQRRSMATRPVTNRGAKPMKSSESDWQQRTELFSLDVTDEYRTYPTVTADELRGRRDRPRKVKMLMRDFIEDSLYNPHYGYFSKQAVIFSPGEPFDFPSIPDEPSFNNELGRRYTEFEDKLDLKLPAPNDTRQLWHTPTELFRPYYGEAIARYLMANYIMKTYPYHDLIVYEMGAGRGTLMLNILDYIRAEAPDVYDRLKYKIIEISHSLAAIQSSQLLATVASRGHADKVEIINRSIFDWRERVPSQCFFIALEVFDNFAHDIIRYDLATEEPLQGMVLITESNDFYEFYEPVLDPIAARYLRVRHSATNGRYRVPYPNSKFLRWAKSQRPFAPNLSDAEYIPTRLMQFFDILEKYFPAHRLVTSDFHTLSDTVKGLNSPVVQTRYQRRMIPVSTPLVHQGYFDILFPTNFRTMESMYRALTGKLSKVTSHEEFMRAWAFVEDTRVQSGENPLLSWYKNASVMVTTN